jgi:hypothetical protein
MCKTAANRTASPFHGEYHGRWLCYDYVPMREQAVKGKKQTQEKNARLHGETQILPTVNLQYLKCHRLLTINPDVK